MRVSTGQTGVLTVYTFEGSSLNPAKVYIFYWVNVNGLGTAHETIYQIKCRRFELGPSEQDVRMLTT